MTEDSVKTVLDLAIRLLSLFIPWLGGLLHLPVIGWFVRLAISYLTGLLARLIARKIDFGIIDAQVEKQVQDAKAKTDALKIVHDTPGATDAQKQKALDDFKNAMRKLTHLDD